MLRFPHIDYGLPSKPPFLEWWKLTFINVFDRIIIIDPKTMPRLSSSEIAGVLNEFIFSSHENNHKLRQL